MVTLMPLLFYRIKHLKRHSPVSMNSLPGCCSFAGRFYRLTKEQHAGFLNCWYLLGLFPPSFFYPFSHSQLYYILLTETRSLCFRIVFGISGFFFCKVIASDRKICKMFTYIIKYQCFISRKVEKERSDFLCFVTNKQQISQDKSQTLLGSLLSRCKDITKNWILQTFPL